MKQRFKSDIGDLIKRIFFVLLIISLLRLLFLLTNYNYFNDTGSATILKAFIYSIRIDAATLLWINGLLLLFFALFPIASRKLHNIFLTIFNLANGLLIFLLVCDNIYFSYTRHRISYEMFYLIPQSFTVDLLLTYCKAGWYWLFLLMMIIFIYTKVFNSKKYKVQVYNYGLMNKMVTFTIILVTCFVGIKGFESRALSPSTVLLYFPPKMIDLISNTGLNLMYSYYKGQKPLEEKKYFTSDELEKRFQIFHQTKRSASIAKPNIVLLVMESFARDYLDSTSKFKASTPFLDSIMKRSLVFRNAFNNGRESTHGLIAILASLPPFMQTPYYHSQYHSTSIRGLGKMLSEDGYDCSFFLGDVDDSFGFKEFTHSIGIDHYYSRKDFNDDRFYNGAWGIHDENFFLYAADVLNKKKSPFFTTIFNVSSHPPYIIPEEYKKQFTITGQNAAQNSVSYVDHAYQAFFSKIKKQDWFSNTIFIFIADHFMPPSDKKEFTAVNINEIPFFIYAPGRPSLQGDRNYVAQQLDVLPTILDLTGYKGNYMSFGNTVLNEHEPRYAVQKMDYIYQIIDSSYALGLNAGNDEVMYLYNYREDQLLKSNLLHDSLKLKKKNELAYQLKTIIQTYNTGFINNRLMY